MKSDKKNTGKLNWAYLINVKKAQPLKHISS